MKRRTIVALGLTSLAFGAIVACSFPDVTYDNGTPAEAGIDASDASLAETSTDAMMDATKSNVDPDGGSEEASTAGDSAVPVDASGCSAVNCDCDDDGYNRIDTDGGLCDGGGNGKGADCDDLINAIHPGTGFVMDKWPTASKHLPVGDWDCDNKTTYQYDYNASCAPLSACNTGFVGLPECGGTSDYLTCKPPSGLTLVCTQTSDEPNGGGRVMGCR